jgi:integral membrane protein (TIGR01906 family)
MKTPRPVWLRIVQLVLALAVPVVLLAADLRIATGHWFVEWEYRKANFPPDSFGLSPAERTDLAKVCVDYLATNASLSLLADLQLPDGEPAFNARELRHMADVQRVYYGITVAGIVAAVALIVGTAILLASRHGRRHAPALLLRGSILTLGILGAIGVTMLLNWDEFFTTFHRVFFAGDTWTFPYSDTLIRLFPMQFWIDVGTVIVGLMVVGTLVVGAIGWIWMQRVHSDTREAI